MGCRGRSGGFRGGPGVIGTSKWWEGFRKVQDRERQSIISDETISDVTREELLSDLGQIDTEVGGMTGQTAQSILNRTRSTLAEARLGKGKYAGRQIQSRIREQVRDRPGRAQTILTR